MRTFLCASALFFICQLPMAAEQESWQSLKSDAEQLHKSDPVYALFKLERAWKILSKKSEELAAKELKSSFAKTYKVVFPGSFSDCDSLTAQQLAEHLRAATSPEKWADWTITRRKDGIYLSIAPRALEHPGYCGNALMAIAEAPADSEIKKNFERSVEEFEAQKARKLSLLPVILRPTDKKFADLLDAAQPLKIGKTKPIRFDLNAFLPKEFIQLTYPHFPKPEATTTLPSNSH